MRPSSYIEIDGETLTQLYVQDCLPMTEIAKRLGCSSITVARRLRLHDIASRPRGPVPLGRTVSGENSGWSPGLAWAIGLIATDGNLSPDGRHLVVRSKDYDMLETLRRCLRLTNRITATSNGRGGYYHTLQWSDRAFYRWLLQLGLTPAKSLTLRPLAIPDDYFADFFRGCIDGDGSVRTYTDRYHVQKNEAYVYERLYLSIVSASRAFIEWLQTTVARLTGVAGSLTVRHKPGAHPLWMLCYAKAKSIRLIAWMYYAATLPCLERKRARAERFLSPLGFASGPPVGRPRVGWLYNVASERRGSSGIVPEWRNADSRPSKGRARKGVRVRIPPPAPTSVLLLTSEMSARV